MKTNRIYHQSLMQTEKFQPEGKWIMQKTRFAKFLAFYVDLRVGISRSTSETDGSLMQTGNPNPRVNG